MDDVVEAGETLNGRYATERELGRGGMATVYLARDLVDDREVAVKVLLPDLAATLGPVRFRREIEIERQLDHENLLGILDAGEADGRLYFVMPFVRGESLRARLDREGQLAVDEAVRIAVAAARGLQYAHERGIVHRDVKPENILLEDDRVLVADFGIARALSADQEQKLTKTGLTLGTPLYMSPEQSLADRTLDGRTDIYALGCVLYEMLAGQPPFTAPTAQAVLARHHLDTVPSLTVVRPTVSDELEDILFAALAKSAADRPASMRQLADSLERCLSGGRTTAMRSMAAPRGAQADRARHAQQQRRAMLLAAGGMIAALGAGGWAYVAGQGGGSAYSDEEREAFRRVAVLYFDDRSPDDRFGYLAEGLSETLIDQFSRLPGLTVVSRNGVLPYRDAEVTTDSIARALGAGLLVTGSVMSEAGNQVKVAVQLMNGREGVPIGAPLTVTLPADSVTLLRDSMAVVLEQRIRESIGTQLRLSEQRVAAGNDAAWTLVQRGESMRKRAVTLWERGDSAEARRLAGDADSLAARAAELDPRWSQPSVLRAELALHRSRMERQPLAAAPWVERGLRHAEAALALEPSNAAALESRGILRYERVPLGLTRDTAEVRRIVEAAERDLSRATELEPARATAWVALSSLSYRKFDVSAANYAAKRAYEEDAWLANASRVLWRLFITSYDQGQPVPAQEWCAEGQARFPEDPYFLRCQLFLMTMPGAAPDVPRAMQLVDSLQQRWSAPRRAYEGTYDRILLAAALGRANMTDSARAVLLGARVDRSVDPRGELRGLEAFARTVIGDHAEALSLLEAYLRDNPEHREGFQRLSTWWWQGLKSEPRYAALIGGR